MYYKVVCKPNKDFKVKKEELKVKFTNIHSFDYVKKLYDIGSNDYLLAKLHNNRLIKLYADGSVIIKYMPVNTKLLYRKYKDNVKCKVITLDSIDKISFSKIKIKPKSNVKWFLINDTIILSDAYSLVSPKMEIYSIQESSNKEILIYDFKEGLTKSVKVTSIKSYSNDHILNKDYVMYNHYNLPMLIETGAFICSF